MRQKRMVVAAFVLALSGVSHIAAAQTSTPSTTGSTSTSGTSGTTSSSTSTGATTPTVTTATSTAGTTTSSQGESQYLSRIAPRYEKLAGSSSNLESLVHGLRTGSEVKLSSAPAAAGTTSGTTASTSGASASSSSSVTFTPATRPMGYGNITRTLSLASKQLAAAGVTNPTPQDLAAALNGGTVKTAQGSTTFEGILKLRADGMGWGKIAHTIGVHPGMGKAPSQTATDSSGSVSTAAGTSTSGSTSGSARSKGVTTASGSSGVAGGKHNGSNGKGVVTASGAAAPQANGRGIVTAGGGSASPHAAGRTSVQSGSGVVSASGAAVGRGVTTAAAGNRGHGNGRSGKD